MMLPQLLLGLRILIADDDYFSAQELSQYLTDAGAQVCGPVPSNDDAIRWITEDASLDGLLLKTGLRDGSHRSTLAEAERRGLPYILIDAALGTHDDPLAREPVLQLPLTGARPIELMSTVFGSPRQARRKASRSAGGC